MCIRFSRALYFSQFYRRLWHNRPIRRRPRRICCRPTALATSVTTATNRTARPTIRRPGKAMKRGAGRIFRPYFRTDVQPRRPRPASRSPRWDRSPGRLWTVFSHACPSMASPWPWSVPPARDVAQCGGACTRSPSSFPRVPPTRIGKALEDFFRFIAGSRGHQN